jgi:hypothetical protein
MYKVSVCVFLYSTTRALYLSEAVNRRQPYHKCKAETHIKYCHTAEVGIIRGLPNEGRVALLSNDDDE